MIAKQIFKKMKKEGCRQITFSLDSRTGMKAVLVIDSIPEIRDEKGKLKKNASVSGGTRFAHSDADKALEDAIKLARAMTRKATVLGIKEGGAKAVILANQKKDKEFLHSVGDFIQTQKGFFKTAIDLGFNLKDAKLIAERTDFIDSLSHVQKGLGSTGENTAEGMVHGFEVICKEILKKPLNECSFAVQGLGAVGMALVKRLVRKGCKIIATDTHKDLCGKAKKLGIEIVRPEEILLQKVDILSPCAVGGVINDRIIPRLKCNVIAGGANNILKNEAKNDKMLLQMGIIFIPDFALNCSGFLQALVERKGGTVQEAREKSKIVAKRIKQIIEFSRNNGCTLLQAAIKLFGGQNEQTIN